MRIMYESYHKLWVHQHKLQSSLLDVLINDAKNNTIISQDYNPFAIQKVSAL